MPTPGKDGKGDIVGGIGVAVGGDTSGKRLAVAICDCAGVGAAGCGGIAGADAFSAT